ncbi:MAG: sulfatase [Candidatus Fermentibacteraceae bacterium]
MNKAMLMLALGFLACGGPARQRPNVLVILMDTIRADHLGCMGYHRNTTPTIDSLAGEGTLFTACQAQSSWTLPAMTTILSGLNAREHGAGRRYDALYGVSDDIPWMPHLFKIEGYETGAFFNVIFMSSDFGFHRGFDHFDCPAPVAGSPSRNAGETVDAFLRWLEEVPDGTPFFAAVHFFDPHITYDPPEPWNTLFTDPGYEGEYNNLWGGVPQLNAVHFGRDTIPPEGLANLQALYDGEIAYTDMQLGRLLDRLLEMGLSENTLIVVVGDHGEEFLEHGGMDHGRTLYQEICHVPLVFCGPGVPRGQVVQTLVAQLNVLPTVLELSGIDPAAPSLFSPDFTPVPVPSGDVLWREGDLASLVFDGKKLIWGVDEDFTEQYDLSLDPGETVCLPVDSVMLGELEWYFGTPALAEAPFVDVEGSMQQDLRNLGYIR